MRRHATTVATALALAVAGAWVACSGAGPSSTPQSEAGAVPDVEDGGQPSLDDARSEAGSIPTACAVDAPAAPSEFADHTTPLLCEPFDTFRIQHATRAPQGLWTTTFHWGSGDPARGVDGDRTLFHNPEDEWYVSEFYAPAGVAPVNPFAIVSDMGRSVLRIRAEPAPAAMLPLMGDRHYTSGMISSRTSLNYRYGYSVIRVRLPGPAGSEVGTWPSAWWVPTSSAWPPEFDLFDNALGSTKWVTAAPSDDVGISYDTLSDNGLASVDFSADYHDFGFGWTEAEISWWLDGKKVRSAPTPATYHQDMFLLFTFAVGGPGAWGGNGEVKPNTAFPADVFIDGIWVYQRP